MSAAESSRGDRWTILAALVASAWLFSSTAAPGLVIEGDCGELVAAASVAGIPHAPGYPTYMTLASALGLVVAPEHLARALNLSSALFGAITVALVCAITLALGRSLAPARRAFDRRAAALLAGLALATSVEFWTQSLSAEVYTLATALVMGTLALVLPRASDARADPRRMRAASLLAGLAFGVHYTAGPVCLLLVGLAFLRAGRGRSRANAARLALAFLLGLTTFLYLPLRSAADPLLDSADPETWRGFLRAVFLLGRPTSGVSAGAGLAHALSLGPDYVARLASQWPPWIGVLAVLGALGLARHPTRPALLLLAAVFVAVSAGSLLMAGFEPSDEVVYEVRFLFLPAHAAACIAAGVGALWIAKIGRARLPGFVPWVVWTGLALGLALWGATELERQDKSDDVVAVEYAEALLADAPTGCLLLTFGDNAWMVLTYMQVVEARRPDVKLVHAPLLVRAWYRRALSSRHPELAALRRTRSAAEVARANPRLPIRTADPIEREVAGFVSVPDGMLMRLVPNGTPLEPPTIRAPRSFDGRHVARDLRERTLLLYRANAYRLTGDWFARARDPERAVQAYAIGRSLPDPEPWFDDWGKLQALLALGAGKAQLELGRREAALESLRGVPELSPASSAASEARRLLEGLEGSE